MTAAVKKSVLNLSPRAICSAAMISFYFLASLGLKGALSETAGADTATVERMAEMGSGADEGTSYAATAAVYALFPEFARMPFVYITGITFIIYCIRLTRGWSLALLASFLLVVPCLTAIGTFQKDLLLVWFVLAVSILIKHSRASFTALAWTLAIYASYAFMFRSYFFLIAAGAVAIYAASTRNIWLRVAIVLATFLALIAMPTDILVALQQPRDLANAERLYEGAVGSRTAFMNLYKVTGLGTFLGNYVYSFWMLDLSLISRSFGVKELFLTFNVLGYLTAMVIGLKSPDPIIRLLGALVSGHFFIIHLFEPDAGSYMRHMSSTLPYALTIHVWRFIRLRSGPEAESSI